MGLYEIEWTQNTCTRGQGRCSFHPPGSGSRCESGKQYIIFDKEICKKEVGVQSEFWLNNNKACIKHDSKLSHLMETSSISQNSTYDKLVDFRIINPAPTSCKKRVWTKLWVDVFSCNSTNWRLTKLSALSGDESYHLLSNF